MHFIPPDRPNNAVSTGIIAAEGTVLGSAIWNRDQLHRGQSQNLRTLISVILGYSGSFRRDVTITPMISARINAVTMMAPANRSVVRLKADFISISAVDPDEFDS